MQRKKWKYFEVIGVPQIALMCEALVFTLLGEQDLRCWRTERLTLRHFSSISGADPASRCKLPVLWSTQLRVGCSALPTDRPAAEIRVQALSLCLFQTYLKLTIAENEWKNTKHHLAWCFEVDVFLLTWNSFSKYPASIKSCKCTINQSRGNKWPVLFK